jgi:glyoxylase-like metal-dependent hydrolase (beta-lactamase superfamily II)
MPVKIDILAIDSTSYKGPGVIHPVLIHDEGNAILVDACMAGMAGPIAEAMEAVGVPLSRLTHIVLTHSDLDHVGSLAELARALPGVQVVCHELEKPYVQADLPPVRLPTMRKQIAEMTGAMREKIESLTNDLEANYRKYGAKVTLAVQDHDMLPCGVEIIHTPGHTPGHICLYVREQKTLIPGDTMTMDNGGPIASPDPLAMDRDAMKQTLLKLAGYDIEKVMCFHGGLYDKDVNQRMKEIAGV